MAIVFAVRGDSLNARYSSGGKTPVLLSTGSESDPSSGADAGTGVLGATILDFVSGGTGLKLATYPGKNNFPASGGLSFLARVKPSYSGSPASISGIFAFYHFRNSFFFFLEHATDGTLICRNAAINGSTTWNFATTAWSPTAGTVYDIAFTWDGSTTSNKVKVWIDGVVVGQATAGVNFATAMETPPSMIIGASHNDSVSLKKFNEFVIWDSEINPAVGGLGLIGSTRAAFVTVSAFDGLNATDPGVGNVRNSTGYVIAGASLTGTLVVPTAAQVKTGVTFETGSATTGTYDGSDRWTDPGQANVKFPITYKANSTSENKTGSLMAIGYNQITIKTDAKQTSGLVAFLKGANQIMKTEGNLLLNQGEDFTAVLKFRHDTAIDPVDLSAATAITVSFPKTDGTWHTESLGSGVALVSGPSDGDIRVTVTAAETALLLAGALQNIEVTYTISSLKTVLTLKGVLEVINPGSL